MTMDVPRRYSKLVHDRIGWWATFPVGLPLEVGDFVQMGDNGDIKYLGSVLDWAGWKDGLPVEGFRYQGKDSIRAHASMSRTTHASAGVEVLAGVAEAQGALQIDFAKAAGFVLDFQGAEGRRFKAVITAANWILDTAKNGQWQKDWVLVTEVIGTSSTTALISEEAATSATLSANVVLPGDLAAVNLADPALQLRHAAWSGSGMMSVCEAATPLYHCVRIRRKWWFGPPKPDLLGKGNDSGVAMTDDPYDEDGDVDAGLDREVE